MVDTFTSNLRLRKIEVNTKEDLWAPPVSEGLNDGIIDLVDQAIAGVAPVDVTAGNVTLVETDGVSDTQRPMFLRAIGTPGVSRNITVPDPPSQKLYVVHNLSDAPVVVKTVSGTGQRVNPSTAVLLYVDSVLDDVFFIQFIDDVAQVLPDWETGTVTIVGATAGDTTATYRYALQSNASGGLGYAAFQLPEFSSTITPGAAFSSFTLSALAPATFDIDLFPRGRIGYPIYMQEAGTSNLWWFRTIAVNGAITTFEFVTADGATVADGTVITLPFNLTLTWPLE